MHDMGVIFHDHEIIDLDRTALAHPADVVSCKVNEHNMFRTFLFITQQFLLIETIFLRSGPARSCTRYGANIYRPVTELHMDLRRRADYLHVIALEIEHVR